jgi:hypothetical protein
MFDFPGSSVDRIETRIRRQTLPAVVGAVFLTIF